MKTRIIINVTTIVIIVMIIIIIIIMNNSDVVRSVTVNKSVTFLRPKSYIIVTTYMVIIKT